MTVRTAVYERRLFAPPDLPRTGRRGPRRSAADPHGEAITNSNIEQGLERSGLNGIGKVSTGPWRIRA